MKKIMFVLYMGILAACNPSQKDDATPKGYLNSPTYREYLSTYQDKKRTLESDREYFSLLGERDFVSDMKYDFYSIYIFKGNRDSILNVYSIKAKGNQCWISYRTFNENKYPNASNNYEQSKAFIVDTFSRLVDCDSTKAIKQALDNASEVVKKRLPKNYDDPFRITFYFDGRNYHRLSAHQVEEALLNQIDTLFKKSPLFKL